MHGKYLPSWNRKRHLDELLVLVDGVQGAADVVGDFCAASLLDQAGQLHDGCFEGELVFIDFVEQGREQVLIWHRDSSTKEGHRSGGDVVTHSGS